MHAAEGHPKRPRLSQIPPQRGGNVWVDWSDPVRWEARRGRSNGVTKSQVTSGTKVYGDEVRLLFKVILGRLLKVTPDGAVAPRARISRVHVQPGRGGGRNNLFRILA